MGAIQRIGKGFEDEEEQEINAEIKNRKVKELNENDNNNL